MPSWLMDAVLLKEVGVYACPRKHACLHTPAQGRGIRDVNLFTSPWELKAASTHPLSPRANPARRTHPRCLLPLYPQWDQKWDLLSVPGGASPAGLPIALAAPAQRGRCATSTPPRPQGMACDCLQPSPAPLPALVPDHTALLHRDEGFLLPFFPQLSHWWPRWGPGNHTSSPRALAKHAVFVLSSHRP